MSHDNNNLPPFIIELTAPSLAELQTMVVTLQRGLEPGTVPFAWKARYEVDPNVKKAIVQRARRPVAIDG